MDMQATRAVCSDSSGIQKLKPVKRRNKAIRGNVVRRRFRLPKVSIVYTAGIAKSQLMTPNPREADRAAV